MIMKMSTTDLLKAVKTSQKDRSRLNGVILTLILLLLTKKTTPHVKVPSVICVARTIRRRRSRRSNSIKPRRLSSAVS